MANRYKEEWDQFINDSDNMYKYISGAYMDEITGRYLSVGSSFDYFDSMRFAEILGYRRLNNDTLTANSIRLSLNHFLDQAHKAQSCVGYFIINENSNIHIYYAAEPSCRLKIEDSLRETVPDIITENRFIGINEVKKRSIYGGIVTGVPGKQSFYIDQVISENREIDFVIAIIARPVSNAIRDNYFNGLQEIINNCKHAGSLEKRFGKDSGYSVVISIPSCSILSEYAEKEKERYEKRNSLWEYCTLFGSSNEENADTLGSALAGSINYSGAGVKQTGNYYMIDNNPLKGGKYGLSRARFDSMEDRVDTRLLKSSLTSYIFSDELSDLIKLPIHEHVGFRVVDISPGINDARVFSINPPEVHGDTIEIGTIDGSGKSYMIGLRQLTEHLLVAGATGSGKTNTIKQIITRASDRHISFCVIEPEKKHYWNLIGRDKFLKVYSTSFDGEPLYLNILEPEEGMSIGNHMGDLFDIFAGLFEMEEATRGGFLGLLKYTYARFGWKEEDIVNKRDIRNKRFPTLKDLLRYLPDFCNMNLVYGDEVRNNIEGSVKLRLEELCTGDIKQILVSGKNITGEALCTGPTVIELDSLSARSKAVVSGIILAKAFRYIKQCDYTDDLKHLIVVEEAHNIFRKRSEYPSPYNITSEYFCRLLDTIRSYGTGVIIADQRVDDIDKTAIADAGTIIAHRLSEHNDIDDLADPMQLGNTRKLYLRSLDAGECIVSKGGSNSVCKIKVNKYGLYPIKNYACIMCKHRALCNYDEVETKLSSKAGIIPQTAKRIIINSQDMKKMNRIIDAFMVEADINGYDRGCALGYIMKPGFCLGSVSLKRRIIYSYLSAREE